MTNQNNSAQPVLTEEELREIQGTHLVIIRSREALIASVIVAGRAIEQAVLSRLRAPVAPGDERTAFEHHARACDLTRDEDEPDEYRNSHVQEYWNGWQARAALDTPAAGDALAWQGLTDAERDGYVGELVDYGTDFVVPLYSIVESIEQRLREKNAAQQAEQGAGR